jgi:hypothetical protein
MSDDEQSAPLAQHFVLTELEDRRVPASDELVDALTARCLAVQTETPDPRGGQRPPLLDWRAVWLDDKSQPVRRYNPVSSRQELVDFSGALEHWKYHEQRSAFGRILNTSGL